MLLNVHECSTNNLDNKIVYNVVLYVSQFVIILIIFDMNIASFVNHLENVKTSSSCFQHQQHI